MSYYVNMQWELRSCERTFALSFTASVSIYALRTRVRTCVRAAGHSAQNGKTKDDFSIGKKTCGRMDEIRVHALQRRGKKIFRVIALFPWERICPPSLSVTESWTSLSRELGHGFGQGRSLILKISLTWRGSRGRGNSRDDNTSHHRSRSPWH